MGLGGLTDAAFWGVAWALFAATAGLSLAVAAIAFFRRAADAAGDEAGVEFTAAYNALAPQLTR